jgi:hypothetical protein
MRTVFITLLFAVISVGLCRGEDGPYFAPKIWDEAKLKDWAVPLANDGPELRHVSEQDYYASPVENLRSYPVYHPDREPSGYLEKLRNMEPELLAQIGQARTKAQWIETGERVFRELHQPPSRTDDPALLAWIRDREAINKSGVRIGRSGEIHGLRWVIEKRGQLRISGNECVRCHVQIRSDGNNIMGAPGGGLEFAFPGRSRATQRGLNVLFGLPADAPPQQLSMARYAVPWLKDDKHASLERMSAEGLQALPRAIPGTFLRMEASPFWINKISDLRNIRHQKFLDATATHRNREPADVARYAAYIMIFAYSGDYGKYHLKPDGTKPLYHLPDDALYAIAEYLWSLDPVPNPKAHEFPPALVARGRRIFEDENCAKCHSGPNYGGEKVTLAEGYSLPPEHPLKEFLVRRSVGTDSGLALKTRKGTGLYKVPSLRGVWYRPLFGHSGWVNSLEDWFNPKRFESDFKLTGWVGPEGSPRAISGHDYGTDLPPDDREALIAFLKTL